MQATEYPFIKVLSITKLKPNGLDQYYGELTSLGNKVYEILDQGKEWSKEIGTALKNGGGAILDSGVDQVIMLGTAHAFGDLFEARIKEFNGEDISQEPSWGLLDPESEKAK